MPGLTTPELVSAYAAGFNRSVLGGHAVASPLGLWLLLALVGPATAAKAPAETKSPGVRVSPRSNTCAGSGWRGTQA